jgi:predicted nucleotide-binding protein
MESPIELLKRLIDEGEKFNFQNFCFPNESYPGQYGGDDTPEWLAWKTRCRNLIGQLTAENSPSSQLILQGLGVQTSGNYPSKFEKAKSTLLLALRTALKAIEQDTFGELRSNKSRGGSPALSNKVFVVHGHDQALKTDVEQFIQQIGLEPIVLHRQPDKGRTLIEKFEQHSDVGYAFILLTPDEIAFTIDQDTLPDSSRKKEKRARPNVIFEFGYFVGKLGRDRVCCLYKEGVILPSDLDGLVYKKVDGSIESQGMAIIKELKAAGYKIQI